MSETELQEYRRVSSHARRTFAFFVSALNKRDTLDLALNQPRHALTAERQEWLGEHLTAAHRQTEHLAQELDSFDRRLQVLERALEMDR